MKKLFIFLSFVSGAAIGSVVAWKLLEKKYEMLTQNEIDSVKAAFKKMRDNDISESESKEEDRLQHDLVFFEADNRKEEILAKEAINKPDITKYASMYAGGTLQNNDDDHTEDDGPHVISPDEFGEMDDYEEVSLVYYSDGVLADENDIVVTDIEEKVGSDFYEHFGEYEDDSVFIRNDERKTDYEILYSEKDFSELMNDRFHTH